MEQTFSYGLINRDGNQQDLLREIYSLRYQVYVKEWAFESPDDHPSGLEYDEYDEHSIHYYSRCKSENMVIGAARIILNSELGFPIWKHFDIDKQHEGVDPKQMGEISRLAVSKEYRRRAIDKAIFGTGHYDPGRIPRYMDAGRDLHRHCEHEIIRGLYLSLYIDSKQRGLTHWYAVMAKGLFVILKRWGISFAQVGPAKNYHGYRAPYLVGIDSVEEALKKTNPDLLVDANMHKFH